VHPCRTRTGYDGTIYTPSKCLLQSTAASRNQRYNHTSTSNEQLKTTSATPLYRRPTMTMDPRPRDNDCLSPNLNTSPSGTAGIIPPPDTPSSRGSMQSFWDHVARNNQRSTSFSSSTPPRDIDRYQQEYQDLIQDRNVNCNNPMAWTLLLKDEDDRHHHYTEEEKDEGDTIDSPIKHVTSNLQYLYGTPVDTTHSTMKTVLPRPIPQNQPPR
jgi:hypothetical protein